MGALPEAFFGEGSAGAGFQVVFELLRSALVGKSVIADQLPRFVLCGMDGSACIVGFEPLFQVGCEADVTSIGKWQTANEINVEQQRFS